MLVKLVAPESSGGLRISSSFLFSLLNVLQQLDAEVENMKKSWESVRGEQEQLEVQDIKEMLQLQDSVKTKIGQVESILELTSRFHQAARQVSSARSHPTSSDQFSLLFKFCCFDGEMK